MKYIYKLKICHDFNELFPTTMYNATKFTNVQIRLAVILGSLVSINCLKKIGWFACDPVTMSCKG